MKLDVTALQFLSKDDFRTLSAVEHGMKNHELVPTALIGKIAKLRSGGLQKCLGTLLKFKLLSHERVVYDGYRLTYQGYDYLALKAMHRRGNILGLGRQIGVGKESDVFLAAAPEPVVEAALAKAGDEMGAADASEEADGAGHAEAALANEELGLRDELGDSDADDEGPDTAAATVVLKLQRLGRTSFRAIKSKRDYLEHRTNASWLYMSRLGALKEYAFMTALHRVGFPVPTPIDYSRHAILMTRVEGTIMYHVRSLPDPAEVYAACMDVCIRLAEVGLIHCDFNEYNIIVNADKRSITLIDFPQMISVDHPNAAEMFDRDVQGIVTWFRKKYNYVTAEAPPRLPEVVQRVHVDRLVAASGFTPETDTQLASLQELDHALQAELGGGAEDSEEEEEEEAAGAAAAAAAAPGSSPDEVHRLEFRRSEHAGSASEHSGSDSDGPEHGHDEEEDADWDAPERVPDGVRLRADGRRVLPVKSVTAKKAAAAARKYTKADIRERAKRAVAKKRGGAGSASTGAGNRTKNRHHAKVVRGMKRAQNDAWE